MGGRGKETEELGVSVITGVRWEDEGKSQASATLSDFHQHPQSEMSREGPHHPPSQDGGRKTDQVNVRSLSSVDAS